MVSRLVALAFCATIAGCGGPAEDPAGARAPGRALTVYLSAPTSGASATQAEAVAAGARLALDDAGGRAGRYTVTLVRLDSSGPERRGWVPAQVAANADRAARDPTAIAYIGELDFGGSAISVPITNEADILQVSPGDGLTSLTRTEPGERAAGPDRYYPTGRRSFVRLTPLDLLQAAALVGWARESGARRVATVSDQSLFGRELADHAALVADCTGMKVTSEEGSTGSGGFGALAERVADDRPQAVVYASGAGGNPPALLAALEAALPRAHVFAAGGVANGATEAGLGGAPKLGPTEQGREVRYTRVAFPPDAYPASGRRVLRRLASGSDAPVASDALYGYESMRLVLGAIKRAGERGGDRRAVIGEALEPRLRTSVIGPLRVDRFGDAGRSVFAGYVGRSGGARFVGERRPRVALAPPRPKLDRPAKPCKELARPATSEAAGGDPPSARASVPTWPARTRRRAAP